ncbi:MULTISPECIES: ATP-binding protein [unclassified Streptomyces]|uniref:ATP-binding protein n=1 Tax=unclassified Streptomyces TaxID=2593676 RepID=UPI00070EAA7D|nr:MULTISPECIES: ATP-binding protein [unclassified Streptomyces]KRD21012.1 ATP-binding protein [Streptomyces sp. Root264]MCX5263118.1 ATP-binding protein [Streptomyces sp. NBC_00199]
MAKDSSLRAVGWARSLPLNSGAKSARDWTRAHLESLAWSRTAPDLVDSVVLAVSELVTNAHVHAHSAAQLILTWDEECLHVTVHDSSPRLPEPRDPGTAAPGGRGLLLVDALADDWLAYHCPRGKKVTACFQPPPQPDPR